MSDQQQPRPPQPTPVTREPLELNRPRLDRITKERERGDIEKK